MTALKKRCEALSKETGKEYLYGEGKIVSTKHLVPPPCGFPVSGKPRPERCINPESSVILDIKFSHDTNKVKFTYRQNNRPKIMAKLKLGNNYEFCYSKNEDDGKDKILKGYPKTLFLKKE